MRARKPVPPESSPHDFIAVKGVSESEPTCFFGSTYSVPVDERPFLRMSGGTPKESALKVPDVIEHPFRSCEHREEVKGHRLQNCFDEDQSAGQIQSSESPAGKARFKFIKESVPG